MQKYELKERGQTNIQLTTNAVKPGGDTIVMYKLSTDVNGNLTIVDITETNPTIASIAGGVLKQYIFNAPNEDCYVLTLFNDYPQFFRVGTPALRVITYHGTAGKTLNYKLLNFDGSVNMQGTLTDLGLGIYYMSPMSVGDYIFLTDATAPIPVHTPYVTDSAGMSGKIIFQKDTWMLLSVPKLNAKISDLVAAIEAKYSVLGSDIFRVFSAYPATVNQSRETLDYKPGVTPVSTKYNFSLIYSDGVAKEITGFWAKTENYDLSALGAGAVDELVIYDWTA